MPLEIQIVNRTGRPYDTFVYNAKTGEILGGIVEISAMKPQETTEVTLHIHLSQIDMYSDNVKIMACCPYCQHDIELPQK